MAALLGDSKTVWLEGVVRVGVVPRKYVWARFSRGGRCEGSQ